VVGDLLQPTHLLFVLVVALLVLGPKRLPEAGRALGRGLRDFRSAISGEEIPERTMPTPPVPPASAQPAPPSDQASSPTEEPAPAPEDTAPTEVRAPSETKEPVTTSAGTESRT
jgi:sec-independent protein translocase protein TatA